MLSRLSAARGSGKIWFESDVELKHGSAAIGTRMCRNCIPKLGPTWINMLLWSLLLSAIQCLGKQLLVKHHQNFNIGNKLLEKHNGRESFQEDNFRFAFRSGFRSVTGILCQPFSGPKRHLRNRLESLRKSRWNEETESLHRNPDFL